MSLRPDYKLTAVEADRLAVLWTDSEAVASALQDMPCLEYSNARPGAGYFSRSRRAGAEAIEALRAKDFAHFGFLVHRAVSARLAERAVDEIDAEQAA